MKTNRIATAILALTAILAACSSPTEPGESGKRYGPTETATETRDGVELTISYNSTTEEFSGTITNTTDTTVANVRVEVHLSNGNELGPTTPVDLAANESRPVMLDASGQSFTWYSVHIEVGSSSS